jgi:hypothetical protein
MSSKNSRAGARACRTPARSSEHEVEAVLRLERLELGHARLRPDDELERWHHVDDELAVRLHGAQDLVAPARDRFLALREPLLHEVLQRRDERAERTFCCNDRTPGDEVARRRVIDW